MYFDFVYELRLVNKNGQVIKRILIIPDELTHFAPADDYKTNCIFLTKWAEDRKKGLLKLLGKNKGIFNICAVRVIDGSTAFETDYIVVK